MINLQNLHSLVTKRYVMVIMVLVLVPSLIGGFLLNNRNVSGQEEHIFDDLTHSLPEAMKKYEAPEGVSCGRPCKNGSPTVRVEY